METYHIYSDRDYCGVGNIIPEALDRVSLTRLSTRERQELRDKYKRSFLPASEIVADNRKDLSYILSKLRIGRCSWFVINNVGEIIEEERIRRPLYQNQRDSQTEVQAQ